MARIPSYFWWAVGCSPTPSEERYLHFRVRSLAYLKQSPPLLDFPSLTAMAFIGIVERVISFSQHQVEISLSIRWARAWNRLWTTESAQHGHGSTSTCNWANLHKRHKTTIKRNVRKVTSHFSTSPTEDGMGIRTCDQTANPYTPAF